MAPSTCCAGRDDYGAAKLSLHRLKDGSYSRDEPSMVRRSTPRSGPIGRIFEHSGAARSLSKSASHDPRHDGRLVRLAEKLPSNRTYCRRRG